MKFGIDVNKYNCNFVQPIEPQNPVDGSTWQDTLTGKKYVYKITDGKWYEFDFGIFGGSLGYCCGGYSTSYIFMNSIDVVSFALDSATLMVGTCVNNSLLVGTPCNSSNYGFVINGQNNLGQTSIINRFEFSLNSLVASQVGNTNTTASVGGGCNNSIYGYMLGGSLTTTTATSKVERLAFPFSSGLSTAIGTLSSNKQTNRNSCNNSLYGYGFGSASGGNYVGVTSAIARLVFPFDSGTVPNIGSLSRVKRQSGALNSSTEGYSLCDTDGSGNNYSSIDKIVFPFDSGVSSVLTCFVTEGKRSAECSSKTNGYEFGGYNSAALIRSTIERLQYSIVATGIIVGNLANSSGLGVGVDNTDFVAQFI